MCEIGLCYNHHFIVVVNYVMEGRGKNGKQLEIIEFDGPQKGTKAKVETAQKNLSDFGHLDKINYLDGEAFDRGM